MEFGGKEALHFIGVGGVGMSGIARVAKDQGFRVSGSDLRGSRYTQQLEEAGIDVFIGQRAENIPEGDVTVVVSTAILDNNPELMEAHRRGDEVEDAVRRAFPQVKEVLVHIEPVGADETARGKTV